MISLKKTARFWITDNHFLFVGLFDSGKAETQTFSVSRNWDGFALAESRTRKSGTVAPLMVTMATTLRYTNYIEHPIGSNYVNLPMINKITK